MANQSIPRNAIQQALNDLTPPAPTWQQPTAAQVTALEQKLGEWLPAGSNTTLPAQRSGGK